MTRPRSWRYDNALTLSLSFLTLAGCSGEEASGPVRSGQMRFRTHTYEQHPSTVRELPRSEAAAMGGRRAAAVPERRTTIVVDIDETLCITDYNCVLWGIGSDDSAPLRDARRVMRQLSERFDIVYLTARPTSCVPKTRRWLTSNGFPDGQIVGSPSLGDFLGQTGFKKKALRRLRAASERVLIGIGDKNTDAEAYRENGMLAIIVNPWSHQRYSRDDIVLHEWSRVGTFFEANADLFTAPGQLAEAILRTRLTLRMPGRTAIN